MKNYVIHFIGICGISMYSLAIYMQKLGCIVQGSDINIDTKQYDKLVENNIVVYLGHKKQNVKNVDIVVYNGAIKDNVELEYARKLKIKCLSRAELLGYILNNYKYSIAVSGAHGKTTTTAIIFHILKSVEKELNNKINLHLGGYLVENQKSYDYNNGDYFVTEACEYKDSFLNFFPYVGVILNIKKEHLDYFKNLQNIKSSFLRFAKNSQNLVCYENVNLVKNNALMQCITTYGFRDGDFIAKNIKMTQYGTTFDCYKKEENSYRFWGKVSSLIYGKHNVLNLLASICVCNKLGITRYEIIQAISTFKGVQRRFEKIDNQGQIFHDYAHHPDEIRATLKVAKRIFKDYLVVFEPHTYSRTKTLMDSFVKVLKNENCIILRTYSAREKYDNFGSAKTLAKKLEKPYFDNYEDALKHLIKFKNTKQPLLFLGAGTIDSFAKQFANFFTEKNN